jgi:predicted glycosyltransferase involved in capsule biosynthesis
MSTILSIIIPIRAMSDRNISDRLSYCVSDSLLDRDLIDFIVVDDGSPVEERYHHEVICKKLRLRYHYIDSQNKNINMARARNIGVKVAQTKYIMFMDIDLYPYPGYYNDILREIQIQKLDEHEDDLIMTGVIYLTQKQGVDQFFNIKPEKRKTFFLQNHIKKNNQIIEKISTGTSVTLMHRERYLELGGYDEKFEQWGYEDLEFNLRAMYYSNKFPLPQNFTKDIKSFSNINTYKGWKSMYKLYGDITFKKDIVLFHIWHEVHKESNYLKGYEQNRQRFIKKITAMSKEARSETCRIQKNNPLFNQFHDNESLSLNDHYKNSPLVAWLQPLKNVPLLGLLLLALKRKLF